MQVFLTTAGMSQHLLGLDLDRMPLLPPQLMTGALLLVQVLLVSHRASKPACTLAVYCSVASS